MRGSLDRSRLSHLPEAVPSPCGLHATSSTKSSTGDSVPCHGTHLETGPRASEFTHLGIGRNSATDRQRSKTHRHGQQVPGFKYDAVQSRSIPRPHLARAPCLIGSLGSLARPASRADLRGLPGPEDQCGQERKRACRPRGGGGQGDPDDRPLRPAVRPVRRTPLDVVTTARPGPLPPVGDGHPVPARGHGCPAAWTRLGDGAEADKVVCRANGAVDPR